MKQYRMERPRKLAAHLVVMPDGSRHDRSVVEIADGAVVGLHPLEGEEPFTEWMGDVLMVTDYVSK